MSFTEPLPPTLRLASTGTLTHGLSVGEVLGVPALSGARVIAGESGLDRVVQRLNVMEVPDVLAWVKPHELLLTTGYPLRNTPQSLDHLIADLDERGLAAIAVKLGRYLDALPDEMLQQADDLGFPLILLANDVGFDDILNQVLTDILNRQAAILARTEEVHRALVQIVLCGGGLQEITDEVAALLGAAVAINDADGQELVASGDERHLAELREGAPGPEEYGTHGDRTVVPVVAGGYTYGRMTAVSDAAFSFCAAAACWKLSRSIRSRSCSASASSRASRARAWVASKPFARASSACTRASSSASRRARASQACRRFSSSRAAASCALAVSAALAWAAESSARDWSTSRLSVPPRARSPPGGAPGP